LPPAAVVELDLVIRRVVHLAGDSLVGIAVATLRRPELESSLRHRRC
jgi:hypothetical protein